MPCSIKWRTVLVAAFVTSQLGCEGNSATDPGLDTRKIEALSPTAIVGTVGGFSPVAPAIRVTGSKSGSPQPGVRVEFVFRTISSPRGSFGSHTIMTDAAGIARAGDWQFGERAGLHQLLVFVDGSLALTFSATVNADVPHHFQVPAKNQARITGQTIDRLFVRAEDRFGNAIPELQVKFSVIAGGGTLGTEKTTTNQEGWAFADSWRLGATPGMNQVTASAAGLEPATFRAEGLDSAALKWYRLEGVKNGASNIRLEASGIVDSRIGLTQFDACLCRQQQGYFVRTITALLGKTTTESGAYLLSGAELLSPDTYSRATVVGDRLVLQAPDPWEGEWTYTWTYREVKDGTAESSVPLEELVFAKLSDRQIYRASPSGTGLTRLTSSDQNSRPAWSPDRRRIAFAKHFPGTQNRGWGINDIYVMDADGSNVTRLTERGNLYSAAWSPDGRKLAVSDEGVYQSDIWVISADEVASVPVHLARDARSPSWSPDGKQIAYVHTSGDDGYHQVYVMTADGTAARPLTEIDPGGIYGLAWSPNGKQIAFSKCLYGDCDLYLMDAGGGLPRRITNVGNAQWAAWSPDGKWIAVTLSTYSGSEWRPSVAYVPAEGGTPRVVVEDSFWPSWR